MNVNDYPEVIVPECSEGNLHCRSRVLETVSRIDNEDYPRRTVAALWILIILHSQFASEVYTRQPRVRAQTEMTSAAYRTVPSEDLEAASPDMVSLPAPRVCYLQHAHTNYWPWRLDAPNATTPNTSGMRANH